MSCDISRVYRRRKLWVLALVALVLTVSYSARAWNNHKIVQPQPSLEQVVTTSIAWYAASYPSMQEAGYPFITFAVFATPAECNILLKNRRKHAVSEDDPTKRWYVEIIGAGGFFYFCSIDSNGHIVLEWQRV